MLNLNSKYIIKIYAAFYWSLVENKHNFVIVMERAAFSLK